jgi:pSer/pThr/pTyr-binding forkhead associated (FHA) protein
VEGEIRIAEDATISPRHARFTLSNGTLSVEDLGSVNGTYVRIRQAKKLAVGDEFRVGRQLLRLEPLVRPPAPTDGAARPWGTPDAGFRYRLSQLLEGGGLGEVFPLREGENAIGREAGDVAFPNDRYVSARHARLDVRPEGITLLDVGSSNGTFVKLAGTMELVSGDQLLIGGQLLRVDL